jgi:transcriptional regulator with XRE-family HTH domain
MAVRIEDAGFEIRDLIMWVYGSGFPKSLDVSKAIDKLGGTATPPEFAAWIKREREAAGLTAKELCERGKFYKNVNHGGPVSNWEAGIGFPNAAQFNLLCDLLGLPFDRRQQVEREILGWRDVVAGVAFTSEGPSQLPIAAPATSEAQRWQGWGTALKPALEPITMARKPFKGTVAANVLEHGTGALNVDGCRVGTELLPAMTAGQAKIGTFERGLMVTPERAGRWPANLCHDGSDEVVGLFPEANSVRIGNPNNPHRGVNHTATSYGQGDGKETHDYRDSGSAARFFYCPKVSKRERGEGNNHPTVKPIALMAYLCRLVTPPGGIILDPFMGSGSTGIAALQEGFDFIGIEREAEYVDIAESRIEKALRQD